MTAPTTATWTVGHDGSDGASHALDWALSQAAGRHVEITLVRAWQMFALEFPLPAGVPDDFAPTRVCDNIDQITDAASDVDVPVSQSIVLGDATQVLLDASHDSELLVVGSRGHGGFRRLLLGSVSSRCATHAVVPTIVVPSSATTDRPIRRIVVGLDGSERARRALAWAMDFATDECEIRVVGAWMVSKSGHIAVTQRYTDELQQARDHFNETLDALEADAGSTLFERRFAYADPATTLLDETDGADLIVVGQRGLSGLSAAILGSVATHVLHHSSIPIAVVPDSESDSDTDPATD